MVEQPFDRETLLDITVNVVPFVILVTFFLLFLIVDPWGFRLAPGNRLPALVVYGHMTFTMVMLALITYVGAKFISRDEP